MYLVCYEGRKSKNESSGFVKRIVDTMQGRYFHAELVFVKDRVADSVFVSAKTDGGYPIMIHKRVFNTYDKPLNVHWFKFTGLSYKDEVAVRTRAEELMESKKYRVNLLKMIESSLPSYLVYCSKSFVRLYFSLRPAPSDKKNNTKEEEEEKKQDTSNMVDGYQLSYDDDPDCIHTFCSDFIALILNESLFKNTSNKLSRDSNVAEMVVELSRLKRIDKVKKGELRLMYDDKCAEVKDDNEDGRNENDELDLDEDIETGHIIPRAGMHEYFF
jgi:hypothetical protein